MTTDRRFSRFNKSPATAAFSVTEIPDDGMCLSAFLIVTESRDARKVLVGHMNPKAPWDHIGALDPSRVEAHSHGWLLPSSHLIFRDSPADAARRIARAQLASPDPARSRPQLASARPAPGGLGMAARKDPGGQSDRRSSCGSQDHKDPRKG